MASSSSSSSSRQPKLKKHQVFLSFRGEDTRHNFTSHLLKALKDKGINVFFDEETLEKGEELSQALLNGIAASNIFIIVLSADYASSKSCLAELSEIMHCKHTERQNVLPIFYHVNPSDVRNLDGSFKTSFNEHESKRPNKVLQRWKDAFIKIGNVIGWHINGGIYDRSETEYIKDIVEDVLKKLNNKPGTGYGEFIGIDDQKEAILRLMEQEGTRVIGLWGMGGIGKTTLAGAVYKEVSPQFDGRDFAQSVRDKLEKQGRESLRNQLLSKLLNQKDFRVDTPSIESTVIQERLNNRRVFVVLDDVDDSDLIEYLGVKHFGHESKILVTSRDKQVLKNGGADKIYEVEKLNKDDSLRLFSKFALKQLNPISDFRVLSNKFVKYAQGNPLALKVLGSNLYQRPKEVWESAVDKLQEHPETKILKVLKISYDGLDGLEKNIFLDIACFFNSERKENVEEILSCCYKGAICGISNLVEKCLLDIAVIISIGIEGRNFIDLRDIKLIVMHDLLQELGRNIVRNEYREPGKRSRLWNPQDVYHVLKNNKGTESIEGIMLDLSQIELLRICPTVFENMSKLRFLKFYFPTTVDFKKRCNKFKGLHADQVDLVSLSDELRYLYWEYCPFKSLPSSFNPKNLVQLSLRNGNMEQLWNEDQQDLVNLRQIDLYNCKNLMKIPNLLGAINLESIFCLRCDSLIELPCLLHLKSLQKLNLGGCCKLEKFPEVPYDLFELNFENTWVEEVLDSAKHVLNSAKISDYIIAKFPEISILESLYYTKLSDYIIAKFPEISILESLYYTKLSDYIIAKFPEISSRISSLDLSETQIEEVPSSVGCLNNLLSLNMSGSSIQNLECNVNLFGCPNFTEFMSGEIPTKDVPSPISRFKSLEELKINHCKSLKLLSELPPSLLYLDAQD